MIETEGKIEETEVTIEEEIGKEENMSKNKSLLSLTNILSKVFFE